MARYTLTIATDDPRELADIAGMLAAYLPAAGPAANGHAGPEPPRPERGRPTAPPPARMQAREPGDDDEIDQEREPEEIPQDGRHLLGWAGQQEPDAMPAIKQWCAARKIKSKIVDLTPQQVRAAYLHVSATMRR